MLQCLGAPAERCAVMQEGLTREAAANCGGLVPPVAAGIHLQISRAVPIRRLAYGDSSRPNCFPILGGSQHPLPVPAQVIPGNEPRVQSMLNRITGLGARLALSGRGDPLHASGHAYRCAPAQQHSVVCSLPARMSNIRGMVRLPLGSASLLSACSLSDSCTPPAMPTAACRSCASALRVV